MLLWDDFGERMRRPMGRRSFLPPVQRHAESHLVDLIGGG